MTENEMIRHKQDLLDIAELGARRVINKLGIVRDEISQREAYRIFGEGRVKVWKQRGMISRVKMGEKNSKATYSLIELEVLDNLEKKQKLKQ